MKTAEITRQKIAAVSTVPGQPAPQAPSTMGVFMDMWRKEGIRGINKGACRSEAASRSGQDLLRRQLTNSRRVTRTGVNAVALRQATNWGSRCVALQFRCA